MGLDHVERVLDRRRPDERLGAERPGQSEMALAADDEGCLRDEPPRGRREAVDRRPRRCRRRRASDPSPRSRPLKRLRLLILGGTSEASALARRIAGDAGVEAILSLAGATANPAPAPIPVRIGGFGGAAGLAAYLAESASMR